VVGHASDGLGPPREPEQGVGVGQNGADGLGIADEQDGAEQVAVLGQPLCSADEAWSRLLR
jgi:hypothetical protein